MPVASKLLVNLKKKTMKIGLHGPTIALDQKAQYGHSCVQVANAQSINLQDVGSVSVDTKLSTQRLHLKSSAFKQEIVIEW